VCENLPQCHFLPRRVHGLHRVGKKFAQCGGPIQLAFLDEHRDERRGHGFGAGTKVKLIIERDALCGPSLSDPGDTLGDDALAPQNGGGHAETFGSPAEYRLQDRMNIDRGVVLLG
jgi:hypothetical protein